MLKTYNVTKIATDIHTLQNTYHLNLTLCN